MTQYRLDCLESPPLEATRGLPPDSVQIGGLWRQITGIGASGNHRRNSGYCYETNVGFSRARRGGLDQPSKLAAVIWGGEYGDQAYFQAIQGLDGQQSPTLGGLQGTDVGVPYRP